MAWVVFALSIPVFSLPTLLMASFLTAALMHLSGFSRCWSLLRRTRILLFMLLLLYAFTTPGVPFFPGWEHASPSHEGLIAGGLQMWRLMLMIAALAALLAYLPKQQLLAGIYVLLLPFKPLGLPVERFAVRLWLTLHYAEQQPKSESLHARWQVALELPLQIQPSIKFDVPKFTAQDAVFLVCYFGAIGTIVW